MAGPSNPDWWGNYKVNYWVAGWQAVIFGSSSAYLNKIINAGFDGVYLDITDVYEYWGPGGESGLNRASAAQEMVNFVKALANYARVTKGIPGFGIFPQNGEALAAHADYVQTVTGVGREDTWYDGNRAQPAAETSAVVADWNVFKAAGKKVLCTDYVTQAAKIDTF